MNKVQVKATHIGTLATDNNAPVKVELYETAKSWAVITKRGKNVYFSKTGSMTRYNPNTRSTTRLRDVQPIPEKPEMKAEEPTVLQTVFIKKHEWNHVNHPETITPPDDQHIAFYTLPVMGLREAQEGLAYIPSAILDREDAKAIIAMLQAQFDLNDKAVQLGALIEAMEDRHGETLDAFMKVMLRKAMVDNGLTEIVLNTSHLFSPTENIELELDGSQPGKLIYRLPEHIPTFSVKLTNYTPFITATQKDVVGELNKRAGLHIDPESEQGSFVIEALLQHGGICKSMDAPIPVYQISLDGFDKLVAGYLESEE